MSSNKDHCDILIIGGGIIGLSIAREIQSKKIGNVIVIEKEQRPGFHTSGRNSGVLHSGVYYQEDSLKAQLCVRGAKLLRDYILEKSLPHVKCGKLILGNIDNETDQNSVQNLHKKSQINGATTEILQGQEIQELEKNIDDNKIALFSPNTWSFDPYFIVQEIMLDLIDQGGQILTNCKYLSHDQSRKIVVTNRGTIVTNHVINCAGLHSDQVAKKFGFATHFQMLTFRGRYWSTQLNHPLQRHVYPLPTKNLAFLGLHLTRTVYNECLIGPSAMPALGRENYYGLQNVHVDDLIRQGHYISKLIWDNHLGIRHHTLNELKKRFPNHLRDQISKLVQMPNSPSIRLHPRIGLRAQLMNTKSMSLINDFLIERDMFSTHILNAVSPAFSSCLAFAEKITNEISSPSN